MSEMVERMARGMCRSDGLDPDTPSWIGVPMMVPGGYTTCGDPTPLWTRYAAKARAALEAMREPTDAMVGAGANEPVQHSWGAGGEYIADPENIWASMIDAALGEASAPPPARESIVSAMSQPNELLRPQGRATARA